MSPSSPHILQTTVPTTLRITVRIAAPIMLAVFFALSLLLAGPAQSQNLSAQEGTERLWPVEAGELRLQQAVAEGLLPGAGIQLSDAQSTQLERFFGRYHAQTRLPIAGASQWMAAATLLAQVDAGSLDLDDPLIRFFPEIDDEKAPVSVRQLLAHTSGLASSHSCLGDRSTTLEACAKAILASPLLADPGAEIRYSEAGYQVAGRIAEIASDQPWTALFERLVKSPLELRQTTYGPTKNPRIAFGVSTTLGDFGRFLQSLLVTAENEPGDPTSNEPLPSSRPGSSLDLMLVPQHGKAKMVYSPYPTAWRPALGTWINDDDASAWAQGLLGTAAWVSSDRTEAGVLMMIARPAETSTLWSDLLPRRKIQGEPAGRP